MRLLTLWVLLFNLVAFKAQAETSTGETRTAIVTRSIEPDASVRIDARNVDLFIEVWEKNQVYVEATVRYDGKSNKKMEEFLSSFQQEVEKGITATPSQLAIDAELEDPNKIQIGSSKIGISLGFSEKELSISYTVKLPASNPLIIEHAYQDLSIKGALSSLQLTQYSGDLNAETIHEAVLDMKYGAARISQIEKGNMTLYEQELQVQKINSLKLNARYSDIELIEAESLVAESYESDFELGKTRLLKGTFKYGDITIQEYLTTGNMDLYEMDLKGSELKELTLTESKYSKLEFDELQSFKIEESYEDEYDIGTLGSFAAKEAKYVKIDIEELEQQFIIDAYEAEIDIQSVSSAAKSVYISGKYIKANFLNLPESYSLKADTKYGKIAYNENTLQIKRYIKDSDELELEAYSKNRTEHITEFKVAGYEITVDFR